MLAQAFNPRTQAAKVEESQWVQVQAGLHGKFQTSREKIVEPVFKKQTTPKCYIFKNNIVGLWFFPFWYYVVLNIVIKLCNDCHFIILYKINPHTH